MRRLSLPHVSLSRFAWLVSLRLDELSAGWAAPGGRSGLRHAPGGRRKGGPA